MSGHSFFPVEEAIDVLSKNLAAVARVSEWADVMGYENEKKFSRHFLRHFRVRPSRVLSFLRLESIVSDLRNTGFSHLEIAWRHSMPDEKALYNFVIYHTGHSPTALKNMDEAAAAKLLEKIGNKIGERI